MEQKMKFDLTDRYCQFLNKFRELIKDSDGVSYFGWMDALTSLVYRIQKTACVPALTEGKGYKEISPIIEDVENDIFKVCEIISACVMKELAELLDENAEKEPNTNI